MAPAFLDFIFLLFAIVGLFSTAVTIGFTIDKAIEAKRQKKLALAKQQSKSAS